MKRFDRKFGADFLATLPTTPGVYLFKDDAGKVLYVGKAKNVRKRLSSYRNASRKKVHQKMRAIVRDATTLEVRARDTEEEALALENELIRTLEPPFNIDGKFAFLYPAMAVQRAAERTLLCFATDTDAWSSYGFRWVGTFRSRPRAKEAFDALVELLALVGHLERTASLGAIPNVKGSRLAGIRRLDAALVQSIEVFLSGASRDGLARLTTALLDKPQARREARHVQEQISLLDDFYSTDLVPLREALRDAGREGTFVLQQERDTLFIRSGRRDSSDDRDSPRSSRARAGPPTDDQGAVGTESLRQK